jgi:hypothetical protein
MALDSHEERKDRNAAAPEPAAGEFPRRLTPEEQRRQRTRSLAIAGVLLALVVLFFLVTIVRLGGNVANRPL